MDGKGKHIGDRIALIRERIEQAAQRSGRRCDDIRLMAVSKTRTYDELMSAYDMGIRLFGENRVQEIVKKFPEKLPPGMELHMIGHLQSNKVKLLPSGLAAVQSVDREKILRELEKLSQRQDRRISLFFEYNTSGEESKSGFSSYEQMSDCVGLAIESDRFHLDGLMTIGPLGGDEQALRRAFSQLAEYRDRLQREYPEAGLRELSMGMSGDFELAVEEGATLVRVGTKLFGERDYT